ncbi:MAG TPA: zf-HC2 domain-containing protein [Pyrinomonadaceae bacterium]|nr:zf-HC2 domain-containing protein [Pyrinomonadaceae bacterium]
MSKIKSKLKEWLAMKTADCKTVSPLFSNELDRKLSISEKFRVRLHLFTCGACLNYVSNLKFMREVFRSQEENLENGNSGIRLSPEAKKRIKQKLI